MAKTITYEDRVTAFIDVLAFRSLIDKTITKENEPINENIKKISDVYNSIEFYLDSNLKEVPKSSKHVTIFSDTIVISFLAKEESEIYSTLQNIKFVIIELLSQGILCRGAITYGKLFHTKNQLFGPAIIEAYLLESKAANYPRIILDRSIIKLAGKAPLRINSKEDEEKYVRSLLGRDSDGMYYIDYFSSAYEVMDEPVYDFPDYIKKLESIIKNGLRSSKNHNKIDQWVKYSWMKQKFNKMVIHFEKASKDNPNLLDFYKKLKKIR